MRLAQGLRTRRPRLVIDLRGGGCRRRAGLALTDARLDRRLNHRRDLMVAATLGELDGRAVMATAARVGVAFERRAELDEAL